MMDAVSGIRPQSFKLRLRRPAIKGGLSGVDWFVFMTILLTITSSAYWKNDIGPQVLIALALLCSAYVAYGMQYHGIVLRNYLLLAWSVLGVCYLGLSWLRWLPGTPVVFIQEDILRMGYFTCLVYPATAAFYLLFAKARKAGKLRLLARICILSALGSAFAYHFVPVYDGWWRVEGEDLGLVSDLLAFLDYGIHNVNVVFWWGALLLAIGRPIWMVLAIGFMLASESAQMRILAILVITVWLLPKPETSVRLLSAFIVIGFPMAGLAVVWYANDLAHGPDMVSRARWWVDSLNALVQNYGFGYGFGCDSVVDATAEERFLVFGKWARLPVMVIHNSFIYVFYSMGLIGGGIFVLFNLRDVAPRAIYNMNIARHAGLMFLMACLTASINVALESPNYVLGLCWIYGYLLEMNGCTVARTSEARA